MTFQKHTENLRPFVGTTVSASRRLVTDFQSLKPSASSRKTTSIVILEKEQSVYMLHERANGSLLT